MDIFPIGTISAASSSGSIDSVSYDMFEPNAGAYSKKQYSVLVTQYQNQTFMTRKKAEPILMLTYKYSNIFSKEYRQIEHFVDSIAEEALNSFYVIDWSRGQTPSAIADSGGDWVIDIDNTQLYSTVTYMKAWRALIWDGADWKEGPVTAITANTDITVDVDTSNYGNLTLANAQSRGWVYPMYLCYLIQDPLSNFDSSSFVRNEDIDLDDVGGFIYSGEINFFSRYKV